MLAASTDPLRAGSAAPSTARVFASGHAGPVAASGFVFGERRVWRFAKMQRRFVMPGGSQRGRCARLAARSSCSTRAPIQPMLSGSTRESAALGAWPAWFLCTTLLQILCLFLQTRPRSCFLSQALFSGHTEVPGRPFRSKFKMIFVGSALSTSIWTQVDVGRMRVRPMYPRRRCLFACPCRRATGPVCTSIRGCTTTSFGFVFCIAGRIQVVGMLASWRNKLAIVVCPGVDAFDRTVA